jgi:hypothetical protein
LGVPRGSQVAGVLGVAVAGVVLASVPLAITGRWNPLAAAAAALIAAAAGVPALRRLDGGPWNAARIGAWSALTAITVLNLRNPSEAVTTDRDPGLYHLKARLLLDTGSTLAPGNPPFLQSPSTSPVTGLGLYPVPGSTDLYTQFLTGPSALQALGLAVLPMTGAMVVSVLLTWVASIALFELAAPVTGEIAAGGAAAAAALSLAWVYFGRGAYSEPSAAALLLVGLLLFAGAARARSAALGLAAGAVLGAMLASRVDAGLAVGAALVGCCVVAARTPARRRVALVTMAGALVGPVAQYADGGTLSPGYVADLQDEVRLVNVAFAGLVAVGLGVLAAGRALGRTPRGARSWERFQVGAAAALVGAAVLFVFLWLAGPIALLGSGEEIAGPVRELQQRESIPTEPHDYSEALGQRLGWAVGAPLVVLGVAGLAAGARRIVDREELAPLVLAGIATVAAYATVSAITPDLPWAMRRLFPTVIPALALLAALGVHVLLPRRAVVRVGAALLVVAGAGGASLPVLFERERAGTLAAMAEVCDAVPAGSALYVVDGEVEHWARPLSGLCDLETARGSAGTTVSDVAVMAAESEDAGRRLFLLSATGDLLPPTDGIDVRLLTAYQDRRIEQTLARPPQFLSLTWREVWLYEVDP